jgi:hypothetical protein
MRDFLYSEISNFCEIPNIPDHSDIAIEDRWPGIAVRFFGDTRDVKGSIE